MSLAATITKGAAVVTAIGTISGGALYLDNTHAPAEQVDQMQASSRVNTILQLVETAAREGAADWICLSIEAEFAALCTELPDHYWCEKPETKAALMDKAGC